MSENFHRKPLLQIPSEGNPRNPNKLVITGMCFAWARVFLASFRAFYAASRASKSAAPKVSEVVKLAALNWRRSMTSRSKSHDCQRPLAARWLLNNDQWLRDACKDSYLLLDSLEMIVQIEEDRLLSPSARAIERPTAAARRL